jgi:phosphoglucosamine mutase
MTLNLFGTDGIRGLVNTGLFSEQEAIENLHLKREVSPALMRLIGEVLGRIHDILPGTGNQIVVGWDERPDNKLLAQYLTLGLQISGCKVIHLGICATPTLHYATLKTASRIGCMITASHNPVADSGLKIFDALGFKTTPNLEKEISELAEQLSQEEREIDKIEHDKLVKSSIDYSQTDWAKDLHINWLNNRLENFTHLFGTFNVLSDFKIAKPLLIDSSKGFASKWFADWLNSNLGIESLEISHNAEMMNHNCGAGEMSPTQTWTFEQARQDSHILLAQLKPAEPGTIVAAALDGDGDRCLIIQATEEGFKVIDGDAIADTVINAGTNQEGEWMLAASIESELSLLSSLDRFSQPVHSIETAVGDRWLSYALSQSGGIQALLSSATFPKSLGVEDSGHLVLPSRHPLNNQNWSLVGDGAATLTAFLLSYSNHNSKNAMKRGWKKRKSATDVNRDLWDGVNPLSDEIEKIANQRLVELGIVENWQRSRLKGEENLMLIHANFNQEKLSLGIRNSGTQAKISVSLRLSTNANTDGLEQLVDALVNHLKSNMS